MVKTKEYVEQHCNYQELWEICDQLLIRYPGNIIEIGAGIGENTVSFLSVASKKNSKVVVIDPFESGWENMPETYGRPYPFNLFESNVSGYKNNLILHKVSSQSDGLLDKLKESLPYTFSFVDGLQYEDAVLNDLNLMHSLNCKIICVDDYKRLTKVSQVPLAVNKFLENGLYDFVVDNKEQRSKAYLIKKDLL
jgi:hypothetical protein